MSTSNRTHALTFVGPLGPGRLWWSRLTFPVLRILAASSPLPRLRLVHSARWIVFGDLPGHVRTPAARRGRRARPGMVFLADFDGDPAEYLAVFGLTITRGMGWSFGMCDDFPGGRPTRGLIDYVSHGRIPSVLEYAAYPGATVRDIDVALTIADRVEELRARADGGDEHEFAHAYDRLLEALVPQPPKLSTLAEMWRCLRRRRTVGDLTVVVPLDGDHLHAPLPLPPATIFAAVPGTHFARVVQFAYGGRLFLLFSACFEGRLADYVDQLVSGLGPCADDIWFRCEGYPGAAHRDDVKDWLLDHRLKPAMFLTSLPVPSVVRIREVLALREQAIDLVAAVQNLPPDERRHELAALWRTPVGQAP